MDQLALLLQVAQQFTTFHPREYPDGRGEYWTLCPYHPDQTLGSFSFSARGYKCFACGAQGSLHGLARRVLGDEITPNLVLLPPKPREIKERPSYLNQIDVLRDFRPLPPEAIAYYQKRGFTDESRDRYFLGYGVLPWSRCHHPRLILPIFTENGLVGLRGRQLACECDPKKTKWLTSNGSLTVLFNAQRLTPGCTVIVTEAPYSAILAMQDAPGVVAVASTSGAGTWEDDWSATIARCHPRCVIIWFDFDPAGEKSAKKVSMSLLNAGCLVRKFSWPWNTKPNTDLADYRKNHGILLALHAQTYKILPEHAS